MNDFLNRLDSPHRLFSIAAAVWAFGAPWFVADNCWPGTLRWTLMRSLGMLSSCRDVTGDFVVIVAVSTIPCFIAYGLVFSVVPALARWVAAGQRQG